MVASFRNLGLTVFPEAGSAAHPPPLRTPLLEVSAEREDRVLRHGFANRIAGWRAASVLTLCAQWKPDVIVCDEIDFGSAIAAERLGLPHATVLVIAAGSFVRPGIVAEPLNALRSKHGLPSDPDLAMPSRYLVLSPFPASFRDPAFPLPTTAHSMRPASLDGTDRPQGSAWASHLEGTPTIYFTLGTAFNLESGDLFTRVLAGLRPLSINLIVTVGPQIDPSEFGQQPEHVHIERYVPQSLILPQCDLVVSHGGSGSVAGALAQGLPSVLIPMGADQPLNAARCVELGLGLALDAVRATPESVREAVNAVLADSGYRRAAEHMRDEINALPGPESAVTLLEQLATEKRPILSP